MYLFVFKVKQVCLGLCSCLYSMPKILNLCICLYSRPNKCLTYAYVCIQRQTSIGFMYLFVFKVKENGLAYASVCIQGQKVVGLCICLYSRSKTYWMYVSACIQGQRKYRAYVFVCIQIV